MMSIDYRRDDTHFCKMGNCLRFTNFFFTSMAFWTFYLNKLIAVHSGISFSTKDTCNFAIRCSHVCCCLFNSIGFHAAWNFT